MGLFQHPSSVRSIGMNTRSVTGRMPDLGQYESSLERDLLEILRFDPAIVSVTPQPIRIEYTDPGGKSRTYIPDGLIYFDPTLSLQSFPVLYEVKYRADFRNEWKTLIPKFRAAKAHGSSVGWEFKVFTEQEIRTPYLKNVKFLWPYRERHVEEGIRHNILQILWDLEEADPDLLLCALCHDSDNRARLIPAIWHLVACQAIGCDLDIPLTMRTRLWPQEELST